MVGVAKQLFQAFGQDKVGQMSAAFAYGAVFSLGPLLLVLISVAGFLFGEKAVSGELFTTLEQAIGAEAARSVQDMLASIEQSQSGPLAFIIGMIGLLIGAAGLSGQLQTAFNTILNVKADPAAGIKGTVYTKVKNIFLVLTAGIVVATSVLVSVIITGVGEGIRAYINISPALLEVANALASFLIFIGVLYGLYRFLPDVYVPRKVVFVASVIVGLLFLLSKIILAFIIGRNGTASAYGAAASVIVLLLWFYYGAQILLLGAEGLKLYGQKHGLKYAAKRFAMKYETVEVGIHNDLSGWFFEAFSRGYKQKSSRRKH